MKLSLTCCSCRNKYPGIYFDINAVEVLMYEKFRDQGEDMTINPTSKTIPAK